MDSSMIEEIEKPAPMVISSAAENDGKSPAPAPYYENAQAIMERVIGYGDLSKLSQAERNRYYLETCKSLELNPYTQPFSYIILKGKLTLYANRTCTDQLRKINNISLEVISRELENELYTVYVRARDQAGRKDEDFGVVSIGELRGDDRANAILKCVSKAKRRVTLSICGLGWPDETEVEDIPDAKKPDEPTNDRSRQTYDAMRQEIEALINSGISAQDFYAWGSDNEPRVREMTEEYQTQMRQYWMNAYKRVKESRPHD
jgi:hypothetical protein